MTIEHQFEDRSTSDGADLMDYANASSNRHLVYTPLDSLTPHPRNPKAHDLGTIDASVGRFGFTEPVVTDERTGYLVSGHGRRATLAAMHDRGEAPPEGIRVAEDGTWLVPTVRGWASRSDSEATAALVALNRTTELGGWVDEDLLSILDDLAAEDADGGAFVGVGFTDVDRDVLTALVERVDAGPADLDALAEEYGEVDGDDHLVRVVLNLPADLAQQVGEAIGARDPAEVVRGWLDQ